MRRRVYRGYEAACRGEREVALSGVSPAVIIQAWSDPHRTRRVEDVSDDPNAIAAVATVGYAGFVWSPPLLGWIADTVNLRAAMGVIVLATLGITITGLFARGKRKRSEDQPVVTTTG